MARALITGASSGIGYELAKLFARDGHDLVLVARRKDRLEAIKQEIDTKYGVNVLVIDQDLSELHAGEALYKYLKDSNLSIDFLVNNAGFGERGPFTEISWEREHQMLQLNIVALTELTKCFVKDKTLNPSTKPARVLNVASTAAFQPGPYMSVYFATKSYVLSFSEAIASELKDQNITVTTLCPGPTETEFFDVAKMQGSLATIMPSIPTGREVADYAYTRMHKGRRVIIHGWNNKLLIGLSSILPRAMLLWMVKLFLKR